MRYMSGPGGRLSQNRAPSVSVQKFRLRRRVRLSKHFAIQEINLIYQFNFQSGKNCNVFNEHRFPGNDRFLSETPLRSVALVHHHGRRDGHGRGVLCPEYVEGKRHQLEEGGAAIQRPQGKAVQVCQYRWS